jgi:transcriptional regulator with XRE-family HTH domain
MIVDIATIGSKIRHARLAKNLSQIELAEKMGVRQGTISRAESGHDLRVGTLLEIARALDLDVMLAPRRLRTLIDHLVDGSASGHTPVYTGGGDEPYFEGDAPNEMLQRGLLAEISPLDSSAHHESSVNP